MFSLLLIFNYVFFTADTNLRFRLFTSNINILISFLSFDFFWGSYLFLVLSECYSFDGMQYLYLQESSIKVLDDDGTSFLRNVCYITTRPLQGEIFQKTWMFRNRSENLKFSHLTLYLCERVTWVTFRLPWLRLVCYWVTSRLPWQRLVCD